MWNEMKTYRGSSSEMEDDFNEDALERAYRRGCEAGYRRAMESVQHVRTPGAGYDAEDGDAGYGAERRAWRIAEEEPRRQSSSGDAWAGRGYAHGQSVRGGGRW